MAKPFHIYRSSAGSGKTFTLARSYLILALSRPNAFRNILGVTFTNKATEEMKSRVVDILKILARGEDHPMHQDLCDALRVDAAELQKRASGTLSDILHQYGRFSVVTIDSFFHQVIRSFAREMGLQGTFTIDMDLDKVLQLVIDQMLVEIGEEKQKTLRSWLTEFAENKVEEGQSWDFRRDISALGKEILKDQFKEHADRVLELSQQPGFFDKIKKNLNEVKFGFENQLKKLAQEAINYLEKEGVDPGLFSRGSKGPIGLFYKLVGDDPKRFNITDTGRAALEDRSKWLKKADLDDARLNHVLDSFLLNRYQEVVSYLDKYMTDYRSAQEVLRYFYAFGILAEINKYLKQYREENDVMLIADLPDFLNQIIRDSDTPYIYEKVGNAFSHYLIDEFQDTSDFQWQNFKPLVKNATDEGNFSMVVGDVKQSIYRFRGGDWDLLQNTIKDDIGDYNVEELMLGINWRSAGRLVRFNNDFFKHTQQFSNDHFQQLTTEITDESIQANVSKQIVRVFSTFDDVSQESPDHKPPDEGAVRVQFISDEDTGEGENWKDEAIRQVIGEVEELQRKGYELRDIAILTRYAKEGKKVADAFIQYRNSEQADKDLRYEVVSSEALFLTSSHLVRFIVSLIKWLNDEKNTIVLSEWLFEYIHYIKGSEKEHSQIFSTTQEWKRLVPAEFVRQRGYLKTLPLYELVESIVKIFSLDQVREEFTYLQGFQDAVLDYAKNERGDIPSFLEWWEEVRKERAIRIADENNAIKILTIHKAKGLEFPVVILPFLSWSLDHEPLQDNILWCEGINQPPFDQLPVVPLKYGKNLAKTYWAEFYYQEKLKAYLDNINLLYVAFTRPVNVLYAYGKLPKEDKLNGINDLVFKYLSDQEDWDSSANAFSTGDIGAPAKHELGTMEYGLNHYLSSPWRGKVSLQIKGSAELNEASFTKATLRGIQLHQLLSRIKYHDDLEQFSGLQERVELTAVVEHVQIRDWFDPKWQVDTEVPILLPGGDFKRVDRVNRSGKETIIIDFKTGSPREKDHFQVREYIDIMQEMGYPGIKGYLVYLKKLEVVEV